MGPEPQGQTHYETHYGWCPADCILNQPGLGWMGVESREQHPCSKLLRLLFLGAHYGFLGISLAAVLILHRPMIPPIVTLRFQPNTHFLTFSTSSGFTLQAL